MAIQRKPCLQHDITMGGKFSSNYVSSPMTYRNKNIIMKLSKSQSWSFSKLITKPNTFQFQHRITIYDDNINNKWCVPLIVLKLHLIGCFYTYVMLLRKLLTWQVVTSLNRTFSDKRSLIRSYSDRKLAVENDCRNQKNSLLFAGQSLCIPLSLNLQCWPRCNVRSLNSSHLAGLCALKGTVDLKALWPGQYL